MATESIVVASSIWDGILIGGAGGFIAGISIAAVNGLWMIWKERADKKKVFGWLSQNSSNMNGNKFRTTRAIASHTNLTEDRVRYICSVHERIMLSTGSEPDRWSIFLRESEVRFRQL